MGKYINKGKLLRVLMQLRELYSDQDAHQEHRVVDMILRMVDTMPAAETTTTVEGEWIGEHVTGGPHGQAHAECSVCHKVRTIDKFCPNCGARMKGGD